MSIAPFSSFRARLACRPTNRLAATRLLLAIVALFSATAVLAPSALAATAPPPLGEPTETTGEWLGADPHNGSAVFDASACDPVAGGLESFSLSGPATGPYGGTFTMTGSYTLVPSSTSSTGLTVASFAAMFTVMADNATVHGTLNATYPPPTSAAVWPPTGTAQWRDPTCGPGALNVETSYAATISVPGGGDWQDAGLANVWTDSAFPQVLFETSLPSPTPAPPALPSDKSQCTSNRWKAFPLFKNQGDCVSYVATHGKNPPAAK
ncbi:MAG: hypothetical protein JWO68_4218 [Actinomycetia bacterium]|nr:hypothetical protein [Actinomycetes bacterium]